MAFSEQERASLDQIDNSGLHLNEGRPCECGSDAEYRTATKRLYSDGMLYKHTCQTCGNRFETWTEG